MDRDLRQAECLLARQVLPQTCVDDFDTWTFHPSLLDACLQVSGVLLEDVRWLPFACAGVDVPESLPEKGFVYVRILEKHASVCHLEVHLLDESGVEVLGIEKLSLRALDPPKTEEEDAYAMFDGWS